MNAKAICEQIRDAIDAICEKFPNLDIRYPKSVEIDGVEFPFEASNE